MLTLVPPPDSRNDGCRYDDLLNACMFRKDPAVLDVMTLMEYLPNCEMEEMPYFDGDNWPDILEDIIR